MRNVGLMRVYKTRVHSSIKKRSKIQIALEYMIVFSFVLIIFAFLFALIATQRAEVISQQLFSQEQLLAQDIATQINNAVSGGNDYSAAVPISTEIGTTPIQVFITSTGTVLVNASIGKQIIQAVAYTQAKSISTNPLFAKGANIYQLPIANGTIALQNSFGTICIDYQCPTTSNLASRISLSTEVVHVAQFNGQSSYIYGSLTGYFGGNNPLTAVAWAYISPSGNGPIFGVTSCPPGGCWNMPFLSESGLTVFGWIWGVNSNNPISYTVENPGWYMLAITYNPSGSGTENFYVDGQLVGSASGQYSPSGTTDYWTTYIGGAKPGGVNDYYNSLIANVQAFATNLTSSQIQALYQEGIGGAPIDLQHLVGWWPLNGNANDYSGNGNNGVIHGPLLFPTVAELFAKVTNQAGQAVSKDIVGFATSLGTFGATGQEYTNYTNSNGIAIAFLNQNQTTGTALVKATAYNGNTSLTGKLVGWWPLNFGQGTTAFDLSGNNNNGKFYNGAYWSLPNYVAQFNGSYMGTSYSSTSYITATVGNIIGGTNYPFTVTLWVKPAYNQTTSHSWTIPFLSFNNYQAFGFLWNGAGLVLHRCTSADTEGYVPGMTPQTVFNNQWHFVAVSVNYPNYYWQFDSQNYTDTNSNSYTGGNNIVIGAQIMQCDGNNFTGQIADVQIYNTSLTPAQIEQIYSEGLAAPPVQTSNLVAWYPLDGNANEYQHGYNGSLTGPVSFVSTSNIKQVNTNASSLLAAQFNGAGANVTIKSSHPLLTGDQATMAVWAYWNSGQHISGSCCGSRQEILGADSSPGYEINPIIAVNDSGTDEAETWVCTTSSCWPEAKSQAHSITPGKWYFLVSRYNGSSLSLWINGVQVASTGVSGNLALQGNGNYTYIASRSNTGSYFNGKVANAQLYNTSLSAAQIQQLYQEGIGGAPIDLQHLVGWWPLNGNANDYSGNGNNGTTNNVIFTNTYTNKPYLLSSLSGYGALFNGQSSYASIPYNHLLVPSNKITVVAWIYPRGPIVGYPTIVSATNGAYTLQECEPGEVNGVSITFWINGNGDGNTCSSIANAKYNQWYMTAITYDGTTANQYQNGALVYSQNFATTMSSTSPIYVGKYPSASNGEWNGSIANVQIYNASLSAQQIQQLYNNQMPPSANASIPLSWSP